jgi:hypothetical protein
VGRENGNDTPDGKCGQDGTLPAVQPPIKIPVIKEKQVTAVSAHGPGQAARTDDVPPEPHASDKEGAGGLSPIVRDSGEDPPIHGNKQSTLTQIAARLERGSKNTESAAKTIEASTSNRSSILDRLPLELFTKAVNNLTDTEAAPLLNVSRSIRGRAQHALLFRENAVVVCKRLDDVPRNASYADQLSGICTILQALKDNKPPLHDWQREELLASAAGRIDDVQRVNHGKAVARPALEDLDKCLDLFQQLLSNSKGGAAAGKVLAMVPGLLAFPKEDADALHVLRRLQQVVGGVGTERQQAQGALNIARCVRARIKKASGPGGAELVSTSMERMLEMTAGFKNPAAAAVTGCAILLLESCSGSRRDEFRNKLDTTIADRIARERAPDAADEAGPTAAVLRWFASRFSLSAIDSGPKRSADVLRWLASRLTLIGDDSGGDNDKALSVSVIVSKMGAITDEAAKSDIHQSLCDTAKTIAMPAVKVQSASILQTFAGTDEARLAAARSAMSADDLTAYIQLLSQFPLPHLHQMMNAQSDQWKKLFSGVISTSFESVCDTVKNTQDPLVKVRSGLMLQRLAGDDQTRLDTVKGMITLDDVNAFAGHLGQMPVQELGPLIQTGSAEWQILFSGVAQIKFM